jgi:transketolase
MRDAFLERVWRAMGEDESIFFTCADFGSPVLDKIREQFPDRFVNVGIAEQNLINVSAGLAIEGYKVFAYAIAPFITMRCYEQIRVSLALLSVVRPMNVNLVGVGAGYSYVVSGPTHQCYEDLSIMRALPNFSIYSPADHVTAAALFDECVGLRMPVAGLKCIGVVARYACWPPASWCIRRCRWLSGWPGPALRLA